MPQAWAHLQNCFDGRCTHSHGQRCAQSLTPKALNVTMYEDWGSSVRVSRGKHKHRPKLVPALVRWKRRIWLPLHLRNKSLFINGMTRL